MLGANACDDGGLDGENIENVADRAAGCIVPGEKKKFDLAHGKLFECAVHDLCVPCCVLYYGMRSTLYRLWICSFNGNCSPCLEAGQRDCRFLGTHTGSFAVSYTSVPKRLYQVMAWTSAPKVNQGTCMRNALTKDLRRFGDSSYVDSGAARPSRGI